MSTIQYAVQNWRFLLSGIHYQLSDSMRQDSEELVNSWSSAFLKENSWVWTHLNVPSLFLGVKCSINGTLQVYGVDERPSGLGIAYDINPEFARKLDRVRQYWPAMKVLVSPRRQAYDDGSWLESISLEQAQKSSDLLLIRAEPEETEFHQFAARSVSSVRRKGDRRYGQNLNFWSEVTLNDYRDFNWNEGFCLKTKKNSKCRGIEIWSPDKIRLGKKKISGAATRTRIIRILQEEGIMYYQSFIKPMLDPDGNPMIYRLFFLYDISKKRYIYAGGLWNSRPNLKVHGAPDCTFGAVE